MSTIYRNTYLKQGIVLHKRQYQENSYLLVLWLKDIGKVSAVSKIDVHASEIPLFSILNIYIKLSPIGKLSQVYKSEILDFMHLSGGLSKFYGLYINEILYSVMGDSIFYPQLFDNYVFTMNKMTPDTARMLTCRFCMDILDTMGYALQCNIDGLGEIIQDHKFYTFSPLEPFMPTNNQFQKNLVKGSFLKRINDTESWFSEDIKQLEQLTQISLRTLAPTCKFLTLEYLSFID